jgi:vitamin B12 transporter
MLPKEGRPVKTILAVLIFAAATGASADEPVETTSVVVTANRLETPESEVAAATTVITAHELEAKKPRSVAEALREVPGVTVTNAGGLGRPTSISIRGTNPGHTLVLIDGIEMNDALSTTRSYDFGNLGPQDVERIEVIRGAESTLYGSDAIGGVINIITKHGSGPVKKAVEAEYGTYDSLRAAGSVSAGDPAFNYYLGAGHQGTGGFPAADRNLGNTINTGSSSTTLTGRMGSELRGNLNLDVVTRFSDSKFDEPATGGPPGYAGDGLFRYRTGEDPGWKGTDREFYGKTSLQGSFSGIFRPALALTYSLDQRSDVHTPVDVNPEDKQFRYDSHRIKGLLQGDFLLSDADTLTVGMESSLEKGSSVEIASAGAADTGLKDSADFVRGVFIQEQWLTDSIFATVGARWDAHEDVGGVATYRVAPGYHIAGTGITLRGSVGTGFKVPSLYQRFSSYGDPGLASERSRSYDFGADQEWALAGRKGAAKIGATVFRTDFDQLIDYDTAANHYTNRGAASSEGLELSGKIEPLRGWSLGPSYTYLRTRDDASGLALFRRPAHQLALELERGFGDFGEVRLGARFTGARDDEDAVTLERVRMPGYAVVDAASRYQVTKDLQIFGRIENLFDRQYEEINGFGTPGRSFFLGARQEI